MFKSDGGPSALVAVEGFPLEYDPTNGSFYWTKSIGKVKAGQQAGNLNKFLNYWQIRYRGVLYYAHRLAFLAMEGAWPKDVVDHVDRDGSNNSWCNLRHATHSENHQNSTKSAAHTSGHKGIHYATRDARWIFKFAGEVYSSHETLEDAVRAKEYWLKEKEYYIG